MRTIPRIMIAGSLFTLSMFLLFRISDVEGGSRMHPASRSARLARASPQDDLLNNNVIDRPIAENSSNTEKREHVMKVNPNSLQKKCPISVSKRPTVSLEHIRRGGRD